MCHALERGAECVDGGHGERGGNQRVPVRLPCGAQQDREEQVGARRGLPAAIQAPPADRLVVGDEH